jgi:hypothetical protein
MLWGEIKKWAKELGYDTIKNKDDGKYYWTKSGSDDPNSSGVASSVSKLARAIFNHNTENKWLDHQKTFDENKELKTISVSDYGS